MFDLSNKKLKVNETLQERTSTISRPIL